MSNVSLAVEVQHLLFLFLVVVAPIWDYYDTRRLKRGEPGRKLRYYRTLMCWLCLAAVVAVLGVGFLPLFTISPAPGQASWLLERTWVRFLVEGVIAVFMVLFLLPGVVAIWKTWTKQPRKYASAVAFKSLSVFLPATWEERRWFSFVSISAGICEEVLFRGFVLHYLHDGPLALNLTLALFLSAIIFGLHHLYLGVGGVVQTVVGGLVFGCLFLLTGNLLLPILFHAASDLRILLLLPPPSTSAA